MVNNQTMKLDFGEHAKLVFQSFTKGERTIDSLMPKEQELVKTYGASRLSDFCKGRSCSRAALTKIGQGEMEILIGAKKEPLWPKGIVGSISHSRSLAGAIVAESRHIKSLGLDIETIGRVQENTWYLLFTEAEQIYLRSIDDDERRMASTLLFSMKECFYKLQYPVTKAYLDFRAVEIVVKDENYMLSVSKEELIGVIPRATQLYFERDNEQVITYSYWLND